MRSTFFSVVLATFTLAVAMYGGLAKAQNSVPSLVGVEAETEIEGIPFILVTRINVIGVIPPVPPSTMPTPIYGPPTTEKKPGEIPQGGTVTIKSKHRVFVKNTSAGTVGGSGSVSWDPRLTREIQTSDSGFLMYNTFSVTNGEHRIEAVPYFVLEPGFRKLAGEDALESSYSPGAGIPRPNDSGIRVLGSATTSGTFTGPLPVA